MKEKRFKFNLTLKQRLQRLFEALFFIPISYIVDNGEFYWGIDLEFWIEDKFIDIEEAIKGYWIGVTFEE